VSLYPALQWWNKPKIGFQWLFQRKGAAATNHFEAGGFIRSNENVTYPNIQFHFLPLAVRYDGSSPNQGHGYQVHIGPMNSDARGHVKIRSNNPKEHPSIQFNYLSTPQKLFIGFAGGSMFLGILPWYSWFIRQCQRKPLRNSLRWPKRVQGGSIMVPRVSAPPPTSVWSCSSAWPVLT
jgi:choline dehydrogenase-like flavoprotein